MVHLAELFIKPLTKKPQKTCLLYSLCPNILVMWSCSTKGQARLVIGKHRQRERLQRRQWAEVATLLLLPKDLRGKNCFIKKCIQ